MDIEISNNQIDTLDKVNNVYSQKNNDSTYVRRDVQFKKFDREKRATKRLSSGLVTPPHLVSDVDLRALFKEIGPICYFATRQNRRGSTLGMVEVVYKSRLDAKAAIKRFNNVVLDGRKMRTHLLTYTPHLCVSGVASAQNYRRRNKVKITAANAMRESLDKQLDEYSKERDKSYIS